MVKRKRLLAWLLCLLMALSMLPVLPAAAAWDGRTAENFGGGTGTRDDPYLIENAAQLYYLSLYAVSIEATSGKHYKLTDNIDLGGIRFQALYFFAGTLDGDGYSIRGLNIDATGTDAAGLIRNFGGTIKNLTLYGTVTGSSHAGAFAGYGYDGGSATLQNCLNYCTVEGGEGVGGFVGNVYSSFALTITDCYNVGAVSGSEHVGGILGCSSYKSGSAEKRIERCANIGAVSASKQYAGGILGNYDLNNYLYVTNCYNTGAVSADSYAGGISGKNGELKYCYNTGRVTADSVSADICYSAAFARCYYLEGVNPEAANPEGCFANTETDMCFPSGFSGFDFTTVWDWDSSREYHYPILRSLGALLREEEHAWDSGTLTAQPTCTAAGSTTYTCTLCAKTRTVATAATGHSFGAWTPGEDGTQHCRRCQNGCGLTETADHSWDGGAVTQAATCVTEGVRSFTCTACSGTKTEVLGATGIHEYGAWTDNGDGFSHRRVCQSVGCSAYELDEHSWDSGRTTILPTCSLEGEKAYTCTVCDSVRTQALDATGVHIYGAWVDSLDGLHHEQRCQYPGCNATETVEHAWNAGRTTKAATCYAPGERTYSCNVCEATRIEELPPTGEHRYGAWTDSGDGQHHRRDCLNEGCTAYELASHAYGSSPKTTTPATCTQPGIRSYYCTACQRTEEEAIAATGHTEVVDEAVSATCTEAGLAEGRHCSVCGEVLLSQAELAALGHDWDEGVVTVAPTLSTPGERSYTCNRCGETRQEELLMQFPFTDVPEGAWYYDAVRFTYEKDLMKGTSATTFSPEDNKTRAMLVTVLWRVDGETPATRANTFIDVPTKQWYTEAVSWAAENGIVEGIGGNLFDPNGNVTREQIAAVMFRYARFKGYSTDKTAYLSSFPDSGKVSGWARASLSWAHAEGLILGASVDGVAYLDPLGGATRAQVAAIVTRYVQNIVNAE